MGKGHLSQIKPRMFRKSIEMTQYLRFRDRRGRGEDAGELARESEE